MAMWLRSPFTRMSPVAEGCIWQRHAKRVVRHVKRHGRVQRVRRVKHWWTCEVPGPLCPRPQRPHRCRRPPADTPPQEEPQPEGTVSHLGVKAVEWSYNLSRPEVTAGKVIVELSNQGEDNHNLKLQREGSGDPPLVVPEAAPDDHTTAGFNLPAGTYRLYCSLFEHDEKGMHATLVVGAAGEAAGVAVLGSGSLGRRLGGTPPGRQLLSRPRAGGEQRAVDAAQVVLIEVGLGPTVAGREEPACGPCGVAFGRRRLVALGREAIEELEVVDERERLERERGRDVAVMDLDQVVAVLFFASRARGSTIRSRRRDRRR